MSMRTRNITTLEQAQLEAVRRWGRCAVAKLEGESHVVGVQYAEGFRSHGRGDTWEQAFDSATRAEYT